MWKSCSKHNVDPDDLVSAAEIAHRLGLRDVRCVYDWSVLSRFPKPVARSRRQFWYWPEVDLWAAEHHPELRRRDPLTTKHSSEVR